MGERKSTRTFFSGSFAERRGRGHVGADKNLFCSQGLAVDVSSNRLDGYWKGPRIRKITPYGNQEIQVFARQYRCEEGWPDD